MRGTSCPRCYMTVRYTKAGKFYLHRNAYGGDCPYGGGTREDAEKRITPLARTMLDKGLVKNPATGNWGIPE